MFIPTIQILFKPIDRFTKLACEMLFLSTMNPLAMSYRYHPQDDHLKSHLDIHLPNLIIKICSNGKKNSNGHKHGNKWKVFLIIDYFLLSILFHNNLTLKVFNLPIYSFFSFIDSLAFYEFYPRRWFYKLPKSTRVHRLHLDFLAWSY